jgi:D-alanyl-D-alanine carboxypeptidase
MRLPPVIDHTGSMGCWNFGVLMSSCPQADMYYSGSVDEAGAGALPYRIMPELLKISL